MFSDQHLNRLTDMFAQLPGNTVMTKEVYSACARSNIFESNILKASNKRNTIQTVWDRGLSHARALPKR